MDRKSLSGHPSHQRTHLMARTLALWAGLGAKIALHKVAKGPCVKWIGANYKVLPRGVEVAIDKERISKLSEVVDTALQSKGLLKDARSLAELGCRSGSHNPPLREYDLGRHLWDGRPQPCSQAGQISRKATSGRERPGEDD